MVVFYGYIRRIVFVLVFLGVIYVDINWIIVFVYFLNIGDFYLFLIFIIIVCLVEVGWLSICIFYLVEFLDVI